MAGLTLERVEPLLQPQRVGQFLEVLRDVTFDSSYPTGGEALSAETLGLNRVLFAIFEPADGHTFQYDYANEKLQAFDSAGGAASALKVAVISGGAAGDLTVTGITEDDTLVAVLQANIVADTGTSATGNKVDTIASLTSEFTISDDDTINNTGGTATTGDKLIVIYSDASVAGDDAALEVPSGTDLSTVTTRGRILGI